MNQGAEKEDIMHEFYSERYGHVVRRYSEKEIENAIEDGVKYQCPWCGNLYYPEEWHAHDGVCPVKGCGGFMKKLW